MTPSNELLMACLETKEKFPALEVEVADGSVYINFDFNAAVVIEPQLEPSGRWWYGEMLEWAPDHGVKKEEQIGTCSDLALLLDLVEFWLREREEEQRKLNELLDSRPDD